MHDKVTNTAMMHGMPTYYTVTAMTHGVPTYYKVTAMTYGVPTKSNRAKPGSNLNGTAQSHTGDEEGEQCLKNHCT